MFLLVVIPTKSFLFAGIMMSLFETRENKGLFPLFFRTDIQLIYPWGWPMAGFLRPAAGTSQVTNDARDATR